MAPRQPRNERMAGSLFRLAIVALAASTLALGGCGDHKKDKAASQTAARVNKEEITVHQINLLLQQQRGLKPEQIDAASRQVLDFLVDQELAVQRTRELKIDQDPRVMLLVDAAKREVLARAYADRIGEAAGKPAAEEVKKYIEDNPLLFKDRRIYSLQELAIEAKPEQVTVLREQLQHTKSATEFVQYLKANDYRFNGDQGVRPAEQMPANVLDSLAKIKDGQMVLLPSPAGALVILLAGSRSEPLDEARAKPAIEQFLLKDARRKLVEADVKALRTSAKIEYVGKFDEAPASAAGTGPAQPAAALPASVTGPLSATAPAAAASGMSAEDISKGLGIKK
jgi:EpsD family peptidyl-prolyl cis-trans isomerase